MTEIRPFRGLRYDPSRTRPADVIAPPYDVVGAAAVEALLARSPYNIAHVESCPSTDEGYAGAAAQLVQWEAAGVLGRDAIPSYYAYEQRFTVLGVEHVRHAFFARLRIHPHEDGVVRPHEATLAGPKEDRLRLLRATRANVSPIFAMFEDPGHHARAVIEAAVATSPMFEATDDRGDSHRLWVIDAPSDIDTLTAAVAASHITIADGHHRYHTALNYLAERRAAGTAIEDDAYILAGLVPLDEPGLVVLPIHRLIRGETVPGDLAGRLATLYEVEAVDLPWTADGARQLWERVQAAAAGGVAFGAVGLEPRSFHLLKARSAPEVDRAMPAGLSAASKAVHVLVLNETILAPMLGLDAAARSAGRLVGFTEDVSEAWHEVDRGEYALAFLVRHVDVHEIVAVADVGEVLPQKSTYFYPKLATGMVLNPLD